MADVQPLRALHYDLAEVGSLDDVAAPPYDVIDPEQRRRLAERSPYNVVRIDLPEGDPDPYAEAATLLERWQQEGAVYAHMLRASKRADPTQRVGPSAPGPQLQALVIRASLVAQTTNEALVRFEVCDTGVGVAQAVQSQLRE